ncbi:MAG: hypothetical protein KUG77_07970 [Nannocystaceae bacterium]|nr:hypothetical protein [Nannocystaceae bacterium]
MTLALHGATAAIHDHVAGPGDYDTVVTALRAASKVDIVSEVTRANVRNLAALAQWLTEPAWRGKVRRWTLRWPGYPSPGLSLPRLGMVTPRVLHAAAIARTAGLEVLTEGFPACVLGPHAEFAATAAPQAYAEVCDGCGAKTTCPGVPPSYLEAFERDLELRAIQSL